MYSTISELCFFICSLGPLVNKVKEFHVYSIVESLCDHMVSEREQLRDMSSLALKTVINELPASSTALVANICKRVTDRLSEAIVRVSINILVFWKMYARYSDSMTKWKYLCLWLNVRISEHEESYLLKP